MVIENNYYKHPFDFVNLPKYLVFAEGLESAGICEAFGYCVLMRLNEETRRISGGVLKTVLARLVRSMGIEKDKLEAILKIGIACGVVIAEGETVAGAVAMESVEEIQSISRKRSEAGRASGEARRAKSDEQTRTNVNTCSTNANKREHVLNKNEHRIGEDRKEKDSTGKERRIEDCEKKEKEIDETKPATLTNTPKKRGRPKKQTNQSAERLARWEAALKEVSEE